MTTTILSHSSRPSPEISPLTDDFSLEITVRDVEALEIVRDRIPSATRVSITFLPGESFEARVAAAEDEPEEECQEGRDADERYK